MARSHYSNSDDETLTGAAGADTFYVGLNDGNDVVTNFANGEDLIDLQQFPTISGLLRPDHHLGRERGHHRSHRPRRRDDPAPGNGTS